MIDQLTEQAPIFGDRDAGLWDVGDDVGCFCITRRDRPIDAEVLRRLSHSMEIVGDRFAGLVVHWTAEGDPVGFDLEALLVAANVAAWWAVEDFIETGQDLFRRLKYAPFPVVAAPAGEALGGGCELALHCDAIQAPADCAFGLTQLSAGLIPFWGGCREMLARVGTGGADAEPPPEVSGRLFDLIGNARVARSSDEARAMGFLRPADQISADRSRLFDDAKARILSLARDYVAPAAASLCLPGKTGLDALTTGIDDWIQPGSGETDLADNVILTELAVMLTGGDADPTTPLGEDTLLDLERQVSRFLVQRPVTLARMERLLAADD